MVVSATPHKSQVCGRASGGVRCLVGRGGLPGEPGWAGCGHRQWAAQTALWLHGGACCWGEGGRFAPRDPLCPADVLLCLAPMQSFFFFFCMAAGSIKMLPCSLSPGGSCKPPQAGERAVPAGFYLPVLSPVSRVARADPNRPSGHCRGEEDS